MKRQTYRSKTHRARTAVAAALAIAILFSGCAPLQKAEKQLDSAADKQFETASSAASSAVASAVDSLLNSSRV